MSYQGISTGTGPNRGDGDTLVDGAVKINSNFRELYTALGDGTTLSFTEKAQDAVNYTITTTSVNKTLSNLEYCTVSSSGLTLTLPPSPSVGDKIAIGIGDNYINTIIDRNNSNIMGLSENMTINVGYITLTLIYINNTFGWRVS